MSKPVQELKWQSTPAGSVIPPEEPDKIQGFQVEEPPFQWFNWFWRTVSEWVDYFEETTDGILGWGTTGELVVVINNEEDFDNAMILFQHLKFVNHIITVVGTPGAYTETKNIHIHGISGSGSIVWNFACTVNSINISCETEVIFNEGIVTHEVYNAVQSPRGITTKLNSRVSLFGVTINQTDEGRSMGQVLDSSFVLMQGTTWNSVHEDHSPIRINGTVLFGATNTFKTDSAIAEAAFIDVGITGKILGDVPTFSGGSETVLNPLSSKYIPKGWTLNYFTTVSDFSGIINNLEQCDGIMNIVVLGSNVITNERVVSSVSGSGRISVTDISLSSAGAIKFLNVGCELDFNNITVENKASGGSSLGLRIHNCNDFKCNVLKVDIGATNTASKTCIDVRDSNVSMATYEVVGSVAVDAQRRLDCSNSRLMIGTYKSNTDTSINVIRATRSDIRVSGDPDINTSDDHANTVDLMGSSLVRKLDAGPSTAYTISVTKLSSIATTS